MAVLRALPPDADGDLFAAPETRGDDGRDGAETGEAEGAGTAPRILVIPGEGGPPIAAGDRFLARLTRVEGVDGITHHARAIRKIHAGATRILGVYRKGRDGSRDGGRIAPVSKKSNREWRVPAGAEGGAQDGELVEAKRVPGPRAGPPQARVAERLGDPFAPGRLSLIALHEHDIPDAFPDDATAEAEAARASAFEPRSGQRSGRGEDLRDLPFVTIDPADARDRDDAVAAFPDADPNNPGGHVVWVAIADVARYVRPGGALDREARRRGNATYFPDRVSPMLPEALSADLCSLHEGQDRACLAVRMVLNADGERIGRRFARGPMRSIAALTYERAQAAADGACDLGPELCEALDRLFAAYRCAAAARDRRQPLDIDLPERRIELNDRGEVDSIRPQERLEAHRLIEEFMILANAAAAEELEEKRLPRLYRVHDAPDPDRIDALRKTVEAAGLTFAKGRAVRTGDLNALLKAARGGDGKVGKDEDVVNMQVLRAQAQARYSTENLGHFGLNLARYVHFTSPIRRYADLIAHRALTGELAQEEADDPAKTAEHISRTERRSLEAERDTADRYIAHYLADRRGAEFSGRISGATRFGLFVRLDETGADGLIPMSALGREYFRFDPDEGTLTGERSGVRYAVGLRVAVRLAEAVPATGGLRFELLSAEGAEGRRGAAPRRKAAKPRGAKRGRKGRKR